MNFNEITHQTQAAQLYNNFYITSKSMYKFCTIFISYIFGEMLITFLLKSMSKNKEYFYIKPHQCKIYIIFFVK